MKYAKLIKSTPQSQPLSSDQVKNSAGGYAWNIDRWARFDRFLILGSEDGTYYIGDRQLTMEHAQNAIEAIKEDGARAVDRIVLISEAGRAPKNDPAIFALALCATYGDDETRILALGVLPRVCRTGTHLFQFAEACDSLRGWGRGLRRAVGRWYNQKEPKDLTFQLVKYGQRNGWSHRDLLRLAHPVPSTEKHKVLFKWVVDNELTEPIEVIEAIEKLKSAKTKEAAHLIREFRLPREAVPTELLTEKLVWAALLEDMPLTAMIRNLGNMSKVGLLTPGNEATEKVVTALKSQSLIRKARVHPIAILNALCTYGQGRGVRGVGEWTVVPEIVDALDWAFYLAFANVEPTGKRLVLGLDVSGSMAGTRVAGSAAFECRQAAAAMSLITSASEKRVVNVAFDTKPYDLSISARQRLDDVVKTLAKTGGGGTDCAAPIRHAIKNKIEADAFVIYTDSETWYGSQHPAEAIRDYRIKTGIPAKLVVVAMASNRFSIGAPTDDGTLNVVGFDSAVPQVIAEFVK